MLQNLSLNPGQEKHLFLSRLSPFGRLKFVASAIVVGFLVTMAAPGAAAVQNEQTQILSAEDETTVSEISNYLNSFVHLEGSFTQVGPTGEVAEGRFYMRRPGRVRFDYAPPSKLLVVADGFWIGIIDRKLKTTDRYPIGSTPYWALLKENVDLSKDARILSVEREPGVILITFDDPTGEAAGEITLVFEKIEEDNAEPRLELRQWLITDAQGLTTSVSLADLVVGKPARNKFFVIQDF